MMLSPDMTEDEVVFLFFLRRTAFLFILNRFLETYIDSPSCFSERLLYVLRQPNHIDAPDPVFHNILFVVFQEEVRVDSNNPKSTFLIKGQLANT